MKHDLKLRSDEYLKENSSKSVFFLPKKEKTLSLAQQEALHRWVEQRMNGEHNLSFDQLRYICEQLYTYSERKTWILNIGRGWNVERIGDVLKVYHTTEKQDQNMDDNTVENSWMILDEKGCSNNTGVQEIEIALQLPPMGDPVRQLEILRVEGNKHKLFTPKWKSNGSPIKIKEFLRGQKVPLHKRGSTSIICMKGDMSNTVVAVFVEKESNGINTGEWMIGADFHITSAEGKDNPQKLVRLRKIL